MLAARSRPHGRTPRSGYRKLVTTIGGILLVDKPDGMTSHDVVSRTRRLAATRKVGHAGTLDPMATGLLVLGLNSATRLLTYVVGLDKEYLATIRLGASTTTDDREGETIDTAPDGLINQLDLSRVDAKILDLTGNIKQVPSTVSAIKVGGKRAYALARAGETVELASRAVTVSEFEVLGRRRLAGFLDLDVRVVCSSGTYIRALARDLGASLAVFGHLTALRRTRIGPFRVTDAHALDELDVSAALLDPAAVAGQLFESVHLDEQASIDLGHGKRIALAHPDGGPIAALAPSGRLIGLVDVAGGVGRSLVNFPPEDTP